MKRIFLSLSLLLVMTGRALCDYMEDGNAMYAKGDFDGAIADYTKAIELNPNNVDAYNNRGATKTTKDDLDRAIADYSKCIQLKPDDAKAYYNRGLAKQTK
jgi:tetratricopeptide (TPR) repeat protein